MFVFVNAEKAFHYVNFSILMFPFKWTRLQPSSENSSTLHQQLFVYRYICLPGSICCFMSWLSLTFSGPSCQFLEVRYALNIKLSLFSDDLLLYFTNSLMAVLFLIHKHKWFSSLSNFKFNYSKSEI